MKKLNKFSSKSKLFGLLALIFAGLLYFASPLDYFGIRNSEINAKTNDKENENTIAKRDHAPPLFNNFGLQRSDVDTQIDNRKFEQTVQGQIRFNFSGYGNPQRPFPGYVGPFQLGPVWISGSGVLRTSDGKLVSGGRISHRENLRDRRYPRHRTTFRVISGTITSSGEATVLRLLVRVTGSNYRNICPIGTRGIIELTDNNSRLGNGHTNDGIRTAMPNPFSRAPDGGAACRTHVHGMNNTDVSWTNPPRGGPPSGGNRATVNITVDGTTPSGNCSIAGRWRQTSRGVSTSIWTFTHLGGNRYRATEAGSGNARGTAVLRGNQLRLDASTRTLTGYYIWTINRRCNYGSGRLVFTRGRRSTHTSTISRLSGTSSIRPSVRTVKSVYAPNERISVRFSGLPGNSRDWITIVRSGSRSGLYGQWFYTNRRRSGTMNFRGLPAGTYEARVHYPGSSTIRARYRFRVAGSVTSGNYRRYANTLISGYNRRTLRATTVSTCRRECNRYSWCTSFEYHKTSRFCNLHYGNGRRSRSDGYDLYVKR